MALILHFHPLSSYCHKVLTALYERGVAFDGQLLNLGDDAARAAYLALWPTGKMPLLVDDGRVVPETSVIIEYLDRHAGGAPLLPAEPEAQLEARLWDRLFDLYVMTPMQAIVADRLRAEAERDPVNVAQARATLAMAYGMIERHMAGDGAGAGRTWAAGDSFSIADCAAAPALFYAATVVPFGPQHVALSAYFERLVARPAFARVLAEARPWFKYYPFGAAIPARFLAPEAD